MILRHVNGRGELRGDSEVNKKTFLSRNSVADGNCKIRDAELYDCVVSGNARVFGGRFHRSAIGKDVVIGGYPTVSDSVLVNSNISGTPVLMNCLLKDFAQVADSVIIGGLSLSEPIIVEETASVYGDAVLMGSFKVGGKMRIASGVWTRAPKYIDLGYTCITESELGAIIDCRDRTLEYWFKYAMKQGLRFGYTESQIHGVLAALGQL